MGEAMVKYQDSRVVLAKKKRKTFLRVLAETGVVSEAALACGWTDTSTVQRYRHDDEEFAEAWDLALLAAANVLEAEAIRRAMEGEMKPIYYKGVIAGYETKRSDTLMMFMLRGMKPDVYRDNSRGGDMNINFGVAVLPMTAQSDDDWEKRATIMHAEQKTITIEAKPVENQMARIQRSD